MPLRVDRADASERQVVERLLQMYLHEMSQYDDRSIGDDGQFEYEWLDQYWADPKRFAYLVRVKGRLAGFVFIRDIEGHSSKPIHTVAEFFLLHVYRGLGIGEEVARMVFDQHEGSWQVAQVQDHHGAQQFWRKVVWRYTARNFRETKVPGWQGPVLEFEAPGCPPVSEPELERAPDPTGAVWKPAES